MQNHMAEDIEKFEVETPGFGLEAPWKTHFSWNAGIGIICGKGECTWRCEEALKAPGGGCAGLKQS